MTITEYLISTHEDWAFILTDEPIKDHQYKLEL